MDMNHSEDVVDQIVLTFLAAYREFWNAIDNEPNHDDDEEITYEPQPLEDIQRLVEIGGARDARLRWCRSFQLFARWLPVLATNSNCEMNEGFDEKTRILVDRHLKEKSRGFL